MAQIRIRPSLPAAVLASLLVAGQAFAADESGRPRPLTVEQVSALEFGKFTLSGPGSGSVTVDPAGRKRVNGGVRDMGGVHQPAMFRVRGEPGRRFSITLPRRVELGAERGPGKALLENFTSAPVEEGVLGFNGEATVRVGATLRLSGQKGAEYRGDFDIYVDYQE